MKVTPEGPNKEDKEMVAGWDHIGCSPSSNRCSSRTRYWKGPSVELALSQGSKESKLMLGGSSKSWLEFGTKILEIMSFLVEKMMIG